MAGFYRSSLAWNPRVIALQIICLQCLYYIAMGIVLTFLHGSGVALSQFFSFSSLNFDNIQGIQNAVAIIIVGSISALFLALLLDRAKQCLDFSTTLYLIDLVACTVYGGFPRAWEWWFIKGGGMTITILLGEYLCSRQELQDIPVFQFWNRVDDGPTLPT